MGPEPYAVKIAGTVPTSRGVEHPPDSCIALNGIE